MLFGPRLHHVSADELRRELEATSSPVLIDVREPDEYAAGHVPGAINLPLGSLPAAARDIAPDTDVVTICQSGHRSVTAGKRLLKAGYSKVRSVKGGTDAWRGPLER